jgi:hypothetical protein
MIPVHAKPAIVHKLGGAHENILNNYMYIESLSVIDAIVAAIPPDDQGKIKKVSLHEGILNLHLMQLCILIIFYANIIVILLLLRF